MEIQKRNHLLHSRRLKCCFVECDVILLPKSFKQWELERLLLRAVPVSSQWSSSKYSFVLLVLQRTNVELSNWLFDRMCHHVAYFPPISEKEEPNLLSSTWSEINLQINVCYGTCQEVWRRRYSFPVERLLFSLCTPHWETEWWLNQHQFIWEVFVPVKS